MCKNYFKLLISSVIILGGYLVNNTCYSMTEINTIKTNNNLKFYTNNIAYNSKSKKFQIIANDNFLSDRQKMRSFYIDCNNRLIDRLKRRIFTVANDSNITLIDNFLTFSMNIGYMSPNSVTTKLTVEELNKLVDIYDGEYTINQYKVLLNPKQEITFSETLII